MSLVPERTHIPTFLKINARSKKEEKKLRTPLKRISGKRMKAVAAYMKARKEYLAEHPYCQWNIRECGWNEQEIIARDGLVFDGPSNGIRVALATEIHHIRGRVGSLLTDKNFFLAVSAEAHRKIHENPAYSYEKGYMLKR